MAVTDDCSSRVTVHLPLRTVRATTAALIRHGNRPGAYFAWGSRIVR
jgi:hypothetical protein